MAKQRITQILADARARTGRLVANWQKVSDDERQRYVRQGGIVLACGVMLSASMAAVSARFETQASAYAYQQKVSALARLGDGGEAARTGNAASPLLEHKWLRRVDYSLDQEPETVLNRYAKSERDLAILSSMAVEAPARVLERATLTSAAHQCLAEAVYYEARSEAVEGQLAVAEVVMNRVADHRYPNSVCEVVYQGAERNTGCQFTFTCDGATSRTPRGQRWEHAQSVAAHVLLDLNEKRTGAATHYHATYVDPVWNAGLIRTDRIGTHIFYRFPRGREWAEVRNAVANKRAARRALIQKVSAEEAQTPAQSAPQVPGGLSLLSPAP